MHAENHDMHMLRTMTCMHMLRTMTSMQEHDRWVEPETEESEQEEQRQPVAA